jgi:hypothetical protein
MVSEVGLISLGGLENTYKNKLSTILVLQLLQKFNLGPPTLFRSKVALKVLIMGMVDFFCVCALVDIFGPL